VVAEQEQTASATTTAAAASASGKRDDDGAALGGIATTTSSLDLVPFLLVAVVNSTDRDPAFVLWSAHRYNSLLTLQPHSINACDIADISPTYIFYF
jgi:hypothetical protein